MPECHRCRWNTEPPTEAKEAACLECKGPPETNHKGKVFVSLDADGGRGRQTLAEAEIAMRRTEGEEVRGQLPDCCRKTALALLDYMDGLTAAEIKVLVAVAHGASLAEVARAAGVTRQAAHGRWKVIVGKFPELAAVLITGKPRRKRGSLGELGKFRP